MTMALFLGCIDLLLRLDFSNRLLSSIGLFGWRNVEIEGCFIVGVGKMIGSIVHLFFLEVGWRG